MAGNLPQNPQRYCRLQGYGLASWAWSMSTLRGRWVWLWATVRRSGGQEQQHVAITSRLGQGDAVGATRVKDEQDAASRSVQQAEH